MNLLLLSLSTSSTFKVLTYSPILDNIKTNDLITISKYPIESLDLVFILINFEMTILLGRTYQILITFFAP